MSQRYPRPSCAASSIDFDLTLFDLLFQHALARADGAEVTGHAGRPAIQATKVIIAEPILALAKPGRQYMHSTCLTRLRT